ncbi:MAG: AsmA family protein [bacterium]
MEFNRRKIFIAVLAALVLTATAVMYLRFRLQEAAVISTALSESALRKFGREIRFSRVGYLFPAGIYLEAPAVSEKPGFQAGEFLKAERFVLKLRPGMLLKGRLAVDEIIAEGARAKLRRRAYGGWNFEELFLLFPESSASMAVTWNVRHTEFRNLSLEIRDEQTATNLRAEGIGLKIDHYSGAGGNFSFAVSGVVSGIAADALLDGIFKSSGKANFEYSRLASSFGNAEIKNIILGQLSAEKISAGWEVFGWNRKLQEKNMRLEADGENFRISSSPVYGASDLRRFVTEPLEIISTVRGKRLPEMREIRVNIFNARLGFKGGVLTLKPLFIESPAFALGLNLELDGPSGEMDLKLDARLGGDNLSITACGPVQKPDIKPELSYTLRRKMEVFLQSLAKTLVKYF